MRSAMALLLLLTGCAPAAIRRASRPVPPEAPREFFISEDSLHALYALKNLVVNHPRMSGLYPRNLLLVAFKPSATQEERQAAIDLVGGEVIGGIGGVFYYVLIQDDGTAEPLWRATDQLEALPQIEYAGPDILSLNTGPVYLRPNAAATTGRPR